MDAKQRTRYIKLVLFSIIIFTLFLRLPALFLRHIENDEVIYQTLAEKLSENPLDYTLRGTYIADKLPETHSAPLFFFHPPLFALMLAFVKIVLGSRFEILVPILSAGLTVWLVFLIGERLYDKKVALVAAGITAVCPVFLHASTKIWIDSSLTFFIASCVYMALIASEKENIIRYILLGLFVAAAILTKSTAFIVLPLVLFILLYKNMTKRRVLYSLGATLAALIFIAPWFYWVYRVCGPSGIWWLKENPRLLEMFPFAKMVKERPFHFYITNLVSVAPIYVFSLAGIAAAFKERRNPVVAFWALLFIGVFTFTGYVMNFGYITRYILPAVPALALLAADFIVRRDRALIYVISIIALGYGFFVGILNSYFFQVADIFPLAYFL